MEQTTKTLYQKDTKGKIRVWSICVIDSQNPNYSEIIVHSGIQNGKLIRVSTPITQGSNIGKVNEKSVRQQAQFDAQTEINKKLKQGYVANILEIKEKDESATIKKPMKAEKYHPTGKNGALTLSKLGIVGKRVGIQRKLDGWRFRLFVSEVGVIFYTSSGDETLGFPQIENAIMARYQSFVDLYGMEEFYLDGEIYNHELGFQATASACGSVVNITAEKKKLRDAMKFYLFDICTEDSYCEREDMITHFLDLEYIVSVDTYYINANDSDIDRYFIQFLNEGYEGLMIRQLDAPYEYKRTKKLAKYKPLIDEEFEVVGFEKSITGDTLGSLVCNSKYGVFSTDLKNEIGTDKYKKFIWDNQHLFKGEIVTVDFLEYTEDNLPRHPRAKCFRNKIDIS